MVALGMQEEWSETGGFYPGSPGCYGSATVVRRKRYGGATVLVWRERGTVGVLAAAFHGSELHPYAQVKTEIAVLGHGPAQFGLGILQVVPDERDVQVNMPLDFELERGDRMVGI